MLHMIFDRISNIHKAQMWIMHIDMYGITYFRHHIVDNKNNKSMFLLTVLEERISHISIV